ncbi:MAG: ABC transporter ATP-binding protein [Halodesulfurarchaeum sp.]
MTTVVASDVEKSYGATRALDGVSLEIEGGTVFSLVGPNGAGKTTFVRCLTGTATLDGGSVRLFGRPPAEVDRNRIGLLPQAFGPPDRLTARELVSYYAGLYDEALDPGSVLERVGLDPADETWYEDLSGGQRRRAAVASALVNDPDLLFLDEPTTGIDPEGRLALWDLFEGLTDDGTTIFLTTHDMSEAERLADEVGLLWDGTLVESGRPRDLVATYGGDSRLIVETDDLPGELPDVEFTVERTPDGLIVRDIEPEGIGDVVSTLEAAGISFDALSWREPTLEDAYLALANGASREEVTG